jgi:7,8-dihydropterin-6-yl-methyl-4-(beta-D-ribofuranosyl)aminobenzene 5'-phosphate synthase
MLVRMLMVLLVTSAFPSPRAPGDVRPEASPSMRITIVYDAFGATAGLTPDWGFAALIEYGSLRILFDTGDDAGIFEHNVRALGIDLTMLDFVVVSHRHGDHIAGLPIVLRENPGVRVYAPREPFGIFGSSLPSSFYRREPSLPPAMRYFDGQPGAELRFGSAWPAGHFVLVDAVTEIAPGVTLVPTVSQAPGTLELHEISLALRTPTGTVLVVGCSHPGIETIARAASGATPDIALIVGGLHLVVAPDSTIARIGAALQEHWHVRQLAPGHCTGEPAFAAFQERFGTDYLFAGLGTVLRRGSSGASRWEREMPPAPASRPP